MSTEPRLDLPYIATSQAQKEVVYNEAMLRLGRLVQASVLSMQGNDPQGESPSPAEGDGYIVISASPGLTGDFVGHANSLAFWNGTGWDFIVPNPGFLIYVEDLRAYWAWDGGDWVQAIALP